MCSLPSPAHPPSKHPVEVGQRSEAIIQAELVKRGYRVLIPFGINHRYDLVLDCGERFVRVQCKTGRLRKDGAIRFHAQSVRVNTRKTFVRPYLPDEVDLFLIYCPDTEKVYAVPIEEATTGGETALRVRPPKNNQRRRVRWAADYELPA
jgi:PD-(D/E)XK endonuclease